MIKGLLIGLLTFGFVAGVNASNAWADGGVDLQITAQAPKTAKPDDLVTSTITITNNTDTAVHRVVVRSMFTAPVNPKVWPNNCKWYIEQYNVNTIECRYDEILPGDSISHDYAYTTPYPDQRIRTKHTVRSGQKDVDRLRNHVVTVTTIKE